MPRLLHSHALILVVLHASFSTAAAAAAAAAAQPAHAAAGSLQHLSAAPVATPVYRDSSQPVDARTADLLARMTLDEKIAQLTYVGAVGNASTAAAVKNGGVGGLQCGDQASSSLPLPLPASLPPYLSPSLPPVSLSRRRLCL
eukprot:COSAG03_NODE_5790_length_1173_cov_5.262570_1_plen_143_part_00